MKKMKKPLLFSLVMLPIAAAGGYFIASYQIDMYDQTTIDQLISQVGSIANLTLISAIQSIYMPAFSVT